MPAYHQVLEHQPATITWPDGQAVQVYPVHKAGVVHTYLRAVRAAQAGAAVVVFDVRDVLPQLAEDLPAAPARDHHGLLLYTARLHCAGAAEFVAQALRHRRGAGA